MRRPVPLCDAITGALIALFVGGGIVSVMLLSIPLYAMWAYHKRKLEEIRGRQRVNVDEATRQAIEDIRREVRDLRDTATAYDVSFDTALKRLDDRMANMEQRVQQAERRQTEGGAEQTLRGASNG